MLQKIILLSSFAMLCFACGDDATSTTSKPAVETYQPSEDTPKVKPKIHETAVDENDILGRMGFGIKTLQEELDKSSVIMPSLGKVTVSIDERANLSIKNEINGEVKETKVNLRDLDTAQGAFRLIPDNAEGEFPGMLIQTIRNQQKVEHLVDGKVRQRNSEIQIFLADREAIGRIAPALLQTVRLAQTIE